MQSFDANEYLKWLDIVVWCRTVFVSPIHILRFPGHSRANVMRSCFLSELFEHRRDRIQIWAETGAEIMEWKRHRYREHLFWTIFRETGVHKLECFFNSIRRSCLYEYIAENDSFWAKLYCCKEDYQFFLLSMLMFKLLTILNIAFKISQQNKNIFRIGKN